MSLKHIKIKGFKSIQSLDLEMKNINILLGANGAGKTNFISVFTFLNSLVEGKLQHYVEEEGGADRFFHFGTKTTKRFVLDIDLGNTEENGYYVQFASTVNDRLMFREEYCKFFAYEKEYTLFPRKGESGFCSGVKPVSEKVAKYTKEYLEDCRVYHFHDTSSSAFFKKLQPIENCDVLEKDAANIAPFLYELKTSKFKRDLRAYQQIVSAIQSVAPFLHDFHLKPKAKNAKIQLRWKHKTRDTIFSADALSDGTARFICLVTLFLQPQELRPSTIIVDEPELGLHPAALSVLADIIKSISKDTQVICSTQSVTFSNHFKPKDFIVVDAKDGVSTFHRPSKKDLKQWLKDYKMGDIWAKNLIGGRPAW